MKGLITGPFNYGEYIMPVGIFVCSGSLLVGAIFGASLNRFIPEHLKKP